VATHPVDPPDGRSSAERPFATQHAECSRGDAGGRPSFELFEQILPPICEERFATGFDDLAEADPSGPVRIVMTHAFSYFPPLVVYGVLVAGQSPHVELIGLEVDEDSFDTIELDPED
jgi:hypothetical protein